MSINGNQNFPSPSDGCKETRKARKQISWKIGKYIRSATSINARLAGKQFFGFKTGKIPVERGSNHHKWPGGWY